MGDWEDVDASDGVFAAGPHVAPAAPAEALRIEFDEPPAPPEASARARRTPEEVELVLQLRRSLLLAELAVQRHYNTAANDVELQRQLLDLAPQQLVAAARTQNLSAIRGLLSWLYFRFIPHGHAREWAVRKPGKISDGILQAVSQDALTVAGAARCIPTGWRTPSGAPPHACGSECDVDDSSALNSRGLTSLLRTQALRIRSHPVALVILCVAMLRASGLCVRLVMNHDSPADAAALHELLDASKSGLATKSARRTLHRLRKDMRRERRSSRARQRCIAGAGGYWLLSSAVDSAFTQRKRVRRGTATGAAAPMASGGDVEVITLDDEDMDDEYVVEAETASASQGGTTSARSASALGVKRSRRTSIAAPLSDSESGLYRDFNAREIAEGWPLCCNAWLEVWCRADEAAVGSASSSSSSSSASVAAVGRWVTVDPLRQVEDQPRVYEEGPRSSVRGAGGQRPTTHPMLYAVAVSGAGIVRDVTRRYTSRWSLVAGTRARQGMAGHFACATATQCVQHGLRLARRQSPAQALLVARAGGSCVGTGANSGDLHLATEWTWLGYTLRCLSAEPWYRSCASSSWQDPRGDRPVPWPELLEVVSIAASPAPALSAAAACCSDAADDLIPATSLAPEPFPTSAVGFARSPYYVLESGLRSDEALDPARATQLGLFKGQRIYPRAAVALCLSADAWLRRHVRVVRDDQRALPVTDGSTGRSGGSGSGGSYRELDSAAGVSIQAGVEYSVGDSGAADSAAIGEGSESCAGDAGFVAAPGPVPAARYGAWQTAPYSPVPYTGGPLPCSHRGVFEMWRGDSRYLPAGVTHIAAAVGRASSACRSSSSSAVTTMASAYVSENSDDLMHVVPPPLVSSSTTATAPATSASAKGEKEKEKDEESVSVRSVAWRAGIPCVEVVTGFAWGKRGGKAAAAPVTDGIIVADEHAQALLGLIAADLEAAAERRRREHAGDVRQRWAALVHRALVRSRLQRRHGAFGGVAPMLDVPPASSARLEAEDADLVIAVGAVCGAPVDADAGAAPGIAPTIAPVAAVLVEGEASAFTAAPATSRSHVFGEDEDDESE